MSFWLLNGFSGDLTDDFDIFSPVVGETSDMADTKEIHQTGTSRTL